MDFDINAFLANQPALIAAGIAVFFAVLWLAARAGRGQSRAEAARLGAELAEVKADLRILESQVENKSMVEDDLRAERAAHGQTAQDLAAVRAELKSISESHAARLEEIRGLRAELETKFSKLASDVLSHNSENFLKLVSERFQQHNATATDDLEKRQKAIADLVKPLDERLQKFDGRINEIEKARNEAYGAIRTQVLELAGGQKDLSAETRKLVQALRAPKTRGRWGEMQLKQVLEMAGMSEHVDFELESTMDSDGKKQRPDAVVHIPGGKSIIIDAKTPLEAYLDSIDAASPDDQQVHLKRHAGHIREHVKVLASKDYQSNLATTPDFVVMFIPGETFVAAAAEVDAALIEFAFQNRVLIATPTTLMALIKAIAYGWQQERMAANAVEVQKIGKEIFDRLSSFAGHLDKVGRALGSSVEAYNKAVGSLEGRVLVSARRFEGLGVIEAGKELPAPAQVEKDTRQLSSALAIEDSSS